jgi:hypothetical protein
MAMSEVLVKKIACYFLCYGIKVHEENKSKLLSQLQ